MLFETLSILCQGIRKNYYELPIQEKRKTKDTLE